MRLYARAIKRAPYLHDAHLGKGKAHFQLGQLQAAQASLRMAARHADEPGTSALYKAKLQALSDIRARAR